MEKQPVSEQNTILITPTQQKKQIGLSLIAFCLSFIPPFIIMTGSFLQGVILTVSVCSPIAGLITGIISLKHGKNQIGTAGMILSIIAIVIPVLIIIVFLLFFIGVATGVISLM